MPERFMELMGQLREMSVENPNFWYGIEFWVDIHDKCNLEIFLPTKEHLPEGGEIKFKYCENIQRWEKIVTLNGIQYRAFVPQDEVEVAK